MNKKIEKIILSMVSKDQKMRASGKWDIKIDLANTIKLKNIIEKYGWPDFELVGKKASQGAWLIAQHADHDLDFQNLCLKLMLQKNKAEKIDPVHIPYLTDRVLVNQGKPQLYGTQFFLNQNKQLVPRPIKSKGTLEKRRRKFRLEPFKKYQTKLHIRQQALNKKKG